jgi:general L-amino acid transport system substrate-binding protein
VAAAVLGNSEKVTFVPLSAAARFPALLSGDIDLLLCATTWTLGRESLLRVNFAGTLYYDGQAFIVPAKSKVRRISDLKGATICVVKGTTHVEGLSDYFGQRGIRYKPLVLEHLSEVKEAFLAGRCQAYTSDKSDLASVRAGVAEGKKRLLILPDVISKEPLGPVVKRGDEDWFTIVRWVLFALIEAEELGITKDNVRAPRNATTNPNAARFLGAGSRFGKALGISPDWTMLVIQSGGNYGEIFERNIGRQSALQIDRGINGLWTKGGLMYAPPFR